MSNREAASRIFILLVLFGGLLASIEANSAGPAALFGMLFGTALERLILNREIP